MSEETPSTIEQILEAPDLAVALESDHFKQFLDQVPVAIAVSKLSPSETIVYANLQFERLIGQDNATVVGASWEQLPGEGAAPDQTLPMGRAITEERDYIGAFSLMRGEEAVIVDAWSNIIEDDDGEPAFRLVALVETLSKGASLLDALQDRVQEKDVQLKELQHRVKNNLQMITALIRIEARGVADHSTSEGFDRLAGRVEALGLLYRALGEATGDTIDLGVYLSEIATAVMRAHAVEGIHLDLQVDTWPVAIDIAMPAGLVVNELMTNALKHAFVGREGGVISLHCSQADCSVLIADDGVGLPQGAIWPTPGKLSSMIVRSLEQNARAKIDVQSAPGEGVRVAILFDRQAVASAG
jgi:two-component sensor histidine kinase